MNSNLILPQINNLLNRLEGVRQVGPEKWVARCPAHPDRSPSLSIRLDGDRILLYCFAGCPVSRIVEAIGMKVSDLFLDSPRKAKKKERPTFRLLAAKILEKALVEELENELLAEIRLIETLLQKCKGWELIMSGSEYAEVLAKEAHRLQYLDYLWDELQSNPSFEVIKAIKEALAI